MNIIKAKLKVLLAGIITMTYTLFSIIVGFICRLTQGNTYGWSTHIYVAIVCGIISIFIVEKILDNLEKRED